MVFDIGAKTTREVFLSACERITLNFSEEGFRFLKSIPAMKASAGDLLFQIHFHSSYFNGRDYKIEIEPWASVLSKRFKMWAKGRPEFQSLTSNRSLATNRVCPGLMVGRWNLIATTPDETVDTICEDIQRMAIPLFTAFKTDEISYSNIQKLERVIPTIGFVQYLLATNNEERAKVFAQSLLNQRPDQLDSYRRAIDQKITPKFNSKSYLGETLALYSVEYGWGTLES